MSDEALRAACAMSDETGERDDDAPDQDKVAASEFFTASAHGEDKTRATYEAWQQAEAKRRGTR